MRYTDKEIAALNGSTLKSHWASDEFRQPCAPAGFAADLTDDTAIAVKLEVWLRSRGLTASSEVSSESSASIILGLD